MAPKPIFACELEEETIADDAEYQGKYFITRTT